MWCESVAACLGSACLPCHHACTDGRAFERLRNAPAGVLDLLLARQEDEDVAGLLAQVDLWTPACGVMFEVCVREETARDQKEQTLEAKGLVGVLLVGTDRLPSARWMLFLRRLDQKISRMRVFGRAQGG